MRRRIRRYRRKPVRRVRRKLFRRRVRRIRSSNLSCKLTRVDSVDVDTSGNHTYYLHFTPGLFPEYTSLSPNFEFCKFNKVVVTVLPMQNVSNNSTSQAPAYVMIPWKEQTVLDAKGFNSLCSIDKAKLYRGTQVGRQSYVPACHVGVSTSSAAAPLQSDKIEYRPKIKFLGAAGPNENINIYVGIIMFQGFADLSTKMHFNVKMDVYCTFYNQNTINI